MSFQQYWVCCSDLSVLSTITTDNIYLQSIDLAQEFEQKFEERFFFLKELKMHNNEKEKNPNLCSNQYPGKQSSHLTELSKTETN